MKAKYCEYCGEEIEVYYEPDKVVKTKIRNGVTTYRTSNEMATKYNSKTCSMCKGEFCTNCIPYSEKLCPACKEINDKSAEINRCKHESVDKKFIRFETKSSGEFVIYEQTCNDCGVSDIIYEKVSGTIANNNPANTNEINKTDNNKHKTTTASVSTSKRSKYQSNIESKTSKSTNKPRRLSTKVNRFLKKYGLPIFFLMIFCWGLVDSINYIDYSKSTDYFNNIYDDLSASYESEINTESLDFTGEQYSTIHNNPDAVDPTYDDLIHFVMNDKTDTILYDLDSFVCADYTIVVHDNAEKAGIKAGVVSVDFYDNSDGHALNVFNTTDKGLVFIDCTGTEDNYSGNNADKTVKLDNGNSYIPKPIFTSGMNYESIGTVKNYEIYW